MYLQYYTYILMFFLNFKKTNMKPKKVPESYSDINQKLKR